MMVEDKKRVLSGWSIIGFSEQLKPCPFCGDKPVMVAAPTRFGIQCDNPKCLALVYTDYRREIYNAEFREHRKMTDSEYEEIAQRTAEKWNRRQ